MKSLLLTLALMGCAGSGLKIAASPTHDVRNWTAVKLIDLPGQPIITKGDSSDGSTTFVTVSDDNKTRYFQIDHTELKLSSVAPFEVSAAVLVEINSFARDVQMKVIYDQYNSVWRCRASESWKAVASRDLRKEGALLLDLPSFNPLQQTFRLLVGIDSATFAVTSLSGVSGSESVDEPYFTSSVRGVNHLFGLESHSTMMNHNFHYACAEAYLRSLPDYKRSLETFEACVINPFEEQTLSKNADMIARVEKIDLQKTTLSEYTAQEFDRRPIRKYNPQFDLTKIETLIQTAQSRLGVDL